MADSLIDGFRRENNLVIDGILTVIDDFILKLKKGYIVPHDPNCVFRMEDIDCRYMCPPDKVSLIPILRNFYKCLSCQYMSRFTILDGKFGVPFCTDYGRYTCYPLMITKKDKEASYAEKDELTKDRIENYVENLTVYRFDKFSIGHIIPLLIRRILISNGMEENVEDILYSFICHQSAYRLKVSPSIGSITQLNGKWYKPSSIRTITAHSKYIPMFKEEICETIFLQLITFLDSMQQYGFLYLNPNVENLGFDEKFVNYRYKGINVRGEVKLILSNFESSGLYFRHSRGINLVCPKEPMRISFFQPLIEFSDDKKYVKITEEIIKEMRQNYYNLIGESFNACTLMLILMSYPPYLRSIQGTHIYDLWKKMWREEDIKMIEKTINERCLDNEETIFSFLDGKWLRVQWLSETLSALNAF